jgi:hypothetical protein
VSRAFVKEDSGLEPEIRFDLPEPDSPGYPEAAARALLEGANVGDSLAAELATGYAWGAPDLAQPIRLILREAEAGGDDRTAQLARRFLRAAGAAP